MEPTILRAFRLLKKTAIVYLLLLYLDRPAGESEIARLLEIDRSTARNHLRSLSAIGLATRLKHQQGYLLTNLGRQMLSGEIEHPKIKNLEEIPPSPIITAVKDSGSYSDSLTTETIEQMEGIPPFDNTPVWSALNKAGITRNHRTQRLATLPHITPDYITAHRLTLKHAGKGNQTGLLISILESGVPAPELNANGHLMDCKCLDCQRLRFRRCWYCDKDPCVCDTQER